MKTIKQIDQEIESLKKALAEVKGTETEVYTRIVGYHRAIDNWNEGKRQEYKERVTFKFNNAEVEERALFGSSGAKFEEEFAFNNISMEEMDPERFAYFKLFTSQYCRNCPPVKEYINRLGLSGEEIDVSTDLGIGISQKYHILSTPTVLFFNSDDQMVGQAFSVSELKKIFARKKVLV